MVMARVRLLFLSIFHTIFLVKIQTLVDKALFRLDYGVIEIFLSNNKTIDDNNYSHQTKVRHAYTIEHLLQFLCCHEIEISTSLILTFKFFASISFCRKNMHISIVFSVEKIICNGWNSSAQLFCNHYKTSCIACFSLQKNLINHSTWNWNMLLRRPKSIIATVNAVMQIYFFHRFYCFDEKN